jgi:hypothetical protein
MKLKAGRQYSESSCFFYCVASDSDLRALLNGFPVYGG